MINNAERTVLVQLPRYISAWQATIERYGRGPAMETESLMRCLFGDDRGFISHDVRCDVRQIITESLA